MDVCGKLLEGSLRDIFWKKFGSRSKFSQIMTSILKTENFDKYWNFREIFKIFFAVSVQNHEDIVESDNDMWKQQIIMRNYFKNQFLIGFYSEIYENLGWGFLYFWHNFG